MAEKLERTLSFPVMLIITINAILGSGVFFLPVVGAKESGPASIIAWVLLSISAIYMAMIFGELTSMFPKAGGVYEFCKQAYGRFVSFVVGWIAILSGNVTIAMLIVGAIMYLLPGSGSVHFMSFLISKSLVRMIVSILFILIFNFIAYRGMQTSSTMLVTFGIITVGTIISLTIPGIRNMNTSTITDNMFNYLGSSILSGLGIIFLTLFHISETFFGLETATFLAGETKDGERVMPKVMIISTIINAIIILLFVVVFLGNISFDPTNNLGHLIPYSDFITTETPISNLADILYGPGAITIYNLLVYLVILGSVAGWIVSAPRLMLAMAQDKLFLSQISKVHPKYKTPYVAIIFQTTVTIGLIMFASSSESAYRTLLQMLTPMALVMYAMVALSLVILRKEMPEKKRHYKAPFVNLGVPLIIMMYLGLIGIWVHDSSSSAQLFRLILSLISVGIPLYLLIEVYYDPKMITSINDVLAFFAVFTEQLTLPKKVRRKVLDLVGNIRNKIVLEYGCSVGTMTIDLAKAVGPYGTIYATDISINDLKITERRIRNHFYKDNSSLAHVHTMHDEKHYERIHPAIPYADAVVSVGVLSYIQDVDKVISDIASILPDGGKICILEFADFFRVIPNVEWLDNNETIFAKFKKAGFSVRVERQKGLLWSYIYVYGIKTKEEVPFI